MKLKTYTADELKEILNKHKEWLESSSKGERANLSFANLSSADLSFANLRSANLRSANLRSADLSFANLSSADLNSADLSFANLISANLSSANLRFANLISANLSSADLSSADLSFANLISANLSSANLRSADLSSANLRSAELSFANHQLINPIEFMSKFDKTDEGYIVYKSFGENHNPPASWKVEAGSIIEELPDRSATVLCGAGINFGTKAWCKENCSKPIWKCLIKWEWLPGVIVPYQTDGKARCYKLQLLEIVDKANL